MKNFPPNPLEELLPVGLLDAFINDGYMRIRLNDFSRNAIADVYESAYPFFRSTLESKQLNRLPEDCGYRPIGIEYSQSPDRPDPAESFTASARVPQGDMHLPLDSARLLYKKMMAVIDVIEPIGELLAIGLAKAVSDQCYEEKLSGTLNRWSCLQINYSRPAEVGSPFIHEVHEDGHLFTIASNTKPGLELYTPNKGYLPIITGVGELLIMPGEIISLLTGGLIRPLFHRVRTDGAVDERLALLFFCDIDPTYCNPWVTNDLNLDIDIGVRVLSNARRFGTEAFQLEVTEARAKTLRASH